MNKDQQKIIQSNWKTQPAKALAQELKLDRKVVQKELRRIMQANQSGAVAPPSRDRAVFLAPALLIVLPIINTCLRAARPCCGSNFLDMSGVLGKGWRDS